jgi:hypothetical protein
MYLMATHIPIYLDGDRKYVGDSWYSDLELGSRFFSPHFGPVEVIGPSLPIELADSMHMRDRCTCERSAPIRRTFHFTPP